MPDQNSVALILGAGPNVGQHVADEFSKKGYKTILVSRKPNKTRNKENQSHLTGDLSNPTSIPGIFSKVESDFGTPSVVVYNAAALTIVNKEDPLSLSLEEYNRDLTINTTSAFVSAKQAISGFNKLPSSASKTFIYTGNLLNTTVIPSFMSLGIGKSASAHFIQSAAEAYSSRGFKFYYADERTIHGANVGGSLSGDAHGKFYVRLSETVSQEEWHQTFVKNVGYKKF